MKMSNIVIGISKETLYLFFVEMPRGDLFSCAWSITSILSPLPSSPSFFLFYILSCSFYFRCIWPKLSFQQSSSSSWAFSIRKSSAPTAAIKRAERHLGPQCPAEPPWDQLAAPSAPQFLARGTADTVEAFGMFMPAMFSSFGNDYFGYLGRLCMLSIEPSTLKT